MKEEYYDLPPYLLIKRYLSETDKSSKKAKELEELIREELNYSIEVDFSSRKMQEKLNRIVQVETGYINTFVNVTAWIFIVIIILSLSNKGCGLIHTVSLPKSLPMINPFVWENISWIGKFILENQKLLSFLSFFLHIAILIVAIGILYRSELARKLALIFLIFKITQNFIEPILYKYVYPDFHSLRFHLPEEFIETFYQFSLGWIVLISITSITIYGYLIYKFTTPEIMEGFN